jgi:hypothetical protein
VGRAGHHVEAVLTAQHGLGLEVQVQHRAVLPADDEQCRRGHLGEPLAGQVGTPAAGDHGDDAGAGFRGSPQRGRRAGARAEVADHSAGDAGQWLGA